MNKIIIALAVVVVRELAEYLIAYFKDDDNDKDDRDGDDQADEE